MKTIYYNAKVYTGTLPLCEAFAVENGRFLFSGSNTEALEMKSDADVLVDLHGNFVCAAFEDSHMHMLSLGAAMNSIPMDEHTGSLEDLIAFSREFLAENPGKTDDWVSGRGWNHDYFSDVRRMPDRFDLDRITTDRPLVATRCCGHVAVVNSRALEVLGITAASEAPEGGQIGIKDGEPDGRFYETAVGIIYDAIPAPDKDTLKNYILSSCRLLNSYGITSSHSDDYSSFRSVPWRLINEAYRELEADGVLTVRINEQSNFETMEDLKDFVESGNVTGTGTDFFRIGPYKMVGDGSLGAGTAYMTVPYSDDPGTTGIPCFTREQFKELISYAHAHEMSVAVHCIGDACLDDVLDAVEAALKEHPKKDHRHGIVHCQITRPDQLQRMADLNMHIYAQSIFLDYDIHVVEARVGKERAASSYSWKTLLKNGCTVSNGSDSPVELPRALAGIQCAVTRTTLRDSIGPYLPDEAFSVQEAIDSYTKGSAFASFEEKKKGQILPGYLADFVVLGGNPFTADPYTIKDIPVVGTYLAGKQVYGE